MNILVIGNGFDLAHELPTKYTDFLEFCKLISKIYTSETLTLHVYKVICQDSKLNDEIKNHLLHIFGSRKTHTNIHNDGEMKDVLTTDYPKSDELFMLINDNFWIEYFLQYNMHGKENWIDFESEISALIQSLDDDMHGLSQIYNIEDIVYDLSNGFLEEKYLDYIDAVQPINPVDNGFSEGITFKEIRNKLLDDLNKLVRALEIYLCEYVGNIEIQKRSPNITELKLDKVLSFNYTDTFSKLYKAATGTGEDHIDSFDYIHGKADVNNTIESNNMVLGIDEYLPDDRKNKDIEFIAFKKFYQRIHKQTGCKYKEWVDKIRQDYLDHLQKIETAKYKELQYIPDTTQRLFNHAMSAIKREKCQVHNLYIFGHSLDVTDKDILRDLILNDNVKTTIFYHNKNAMGKQIANLVKVIGQDELIRRTGGSTKTIEFVPQKPMVPIES